MSSTRLLLSTILMLILTLNLAAQNPIPNPGFEGWSGSTPDGWYTTNIPGFPAITPSSDSYSGNLAMRGETLDLGGFPFPPSASTGNFPDLGFPVTQRHQTLTGYYQFTGVNPADSFLVEVFMMKDGAALGGASVFLGPTTGGYLPLSLTIAYGAPGIPDTCIINLVIFNITGLPGVGSAFLLDDLGFDGLNGIGQRESALPEGFSLAQNFPNPFNPETTIPFTVATRSRVSFRVFDLLGQAVWEKDLGWVSSGDHRFSWKGVKQDGTPAPSGAYFYQMAVRTIDNKSYLKTNRMLLLK